jgi:hypothetical protein
MKLEGSVKVLKDGISGGFMMGMLLVCSIATAQTAPTPVPHKPRSTAKVAMAVWSPDVQKALGVSSDDFKADGLNKLTQPQLANLMTSAKPDPNKHWLVCPASGTTPVGQIHVYLTVAGDDSTGAIAGQIRHAVSSLTGVLVVDTAATADRALHVVIQEQTTAKRTIGFTASYLTGTPCTEEIAGKKTDVELKGTLGTYTDAKGAGLATDLAGMLDQDLQPLRAGSNPSTR